MKDDSDGDKKQQIHHIQNLYAFNLFCQKRFDDSMQVFAKLGTGKSFDTIFLFFVLVWKLIILAKLLHIITLLSMF